jgi:uncharacterized protein YraI
MLVRTLSASLLGIALLAGVAHTQDVMRSDDIALAKNSMRLLGGPSMDYPRIGIITWGQGVTVLGCQADSGWCEIVADGQRGWVPSAKLTWPTNERKPIEPASALRVTI